MKLILDSVSGSAWETLDSREAGSVTWAKGFSCSDLELKSIWEGTGNKAESKNTNPPSTGESFDLPSRYLWVRLVWRHEGAEGRFVERRRVEGQNSHSQILGIDLDGQTIKLDLLHQLIHGLQSSVEDERVAKYFYDDFKGKQNQTDIGEKDRGGV